MAPSPIPHRLRESWVGWDARVPVLGEGDRSYANLDSTASTPALRIVRDRVDAFLTWYSSVHRGSGYKSRVATAAYEDAREVVGEFVGADHQRDRVVFTKHTTESLNVLAAAFGRSPGDRVAASLMEHHSNLLPWRRLGLVDEIAVDAEGRLRLESLEDILRRGAGRVRLVALSGASNVTGFVNPIHEAARLAHAHGARIVVDAAQLIAHRPIDMLPHDHPEHLDFVVFSGHKIYAPYGGGALVGAADVLDQGEPLLAGGGAVDLVTRDEVMWDVAPERMEAGSPNVVGAVALATAIQAVEALGWDTIETIERHLTARVLTGLATIPDVAILGSSDPTRLDDRLGVITFTVRDLHYGRVAAALSHEWGVGVRDGCFCAHPYLLHLLRVDDATVARSRDAIRVGDRREIPGALRASVAPYNTDEDVDRLVAGLRAITSGRVGADYRQDRATGAFEPVDGGPDPRSAFAVRLAASEA